MIAIRVDGNPQIATGHVMRCLAIANGLKKAGKTPLFIVADDNSEQLLHPSGYQIINLHTQWDMLDSEIPQITAVLRQHTISKLIVDTYFVTETYLSALEDVCPAIYIDDMNLFRYPVSVVVNYNIYAFDIPYEEIYRGTKTKLLLGPQYAPLREEFQNIEPCIRDTVRKILITVGGSDRYNIAGKILRQITADERFSGIEFHVVAGRLNPHIAELRGLVDDNPLIRIHQNVTEMAKLMHSCDLAVTAGGSTMYELCACGVPSVCFSWADNQLMSVKAFSEKGLIPSAGDMREDEVKCIWGIVDCLNKYLQDSSLRRGKSSGMRSVTDGRGAGIFVREILLE